MTGITKLAQREKFEAWWEREYKHLESSKYTDAVPHIKYGFWMAYQAGGAELVEAVEKAQQRIAELESRSVKLPDELSGETLLDVASRTDLVYSDGTGILEYTNINGCFVKVTAPPDKVIRFRCSNKRIYMRLVDRVKTHENAGIIIDFHKNNKDFIQ